MIERVFLLAIHNHQPVGNFETVFESAFRDCYRPLLRTLGGHPRFKFTVHFSGPLWEFMERREKECWDLVGEMTARGQAELLSGGFYEPILPVIPEDDRLEQIGLMNRFLERSFGAKPRGLWLAERVWEPDLPRTLARAGIEYTLLDEEHFRYAGVEDIHGPYLTEDEGLALRVFPIDKALRYLIPFHPIEEVRDYLGRIHDRGGLAILGDDGEKFGLWPGTNKLVYGEGWLSRFLDLLDAEGIVPLTFAESLEAFPPRGRVYLPPASYEEMMEWVLEPEEQAAFKKLRNEHPGPEGRFLRGGFFRDFFRKYPESNNLHKRMLLAAARARRQRDEKARRLVFRAQGNDPYWHGVFGGLYLPHLREAAYRHLIQAEKRMPGPPGWTRGDYDDDGFEEWIARTPRHSLFVKPSYGGALVSLDSLRLERNVLDVLSRHREAYHQERTGDSPAGKSIHELARRLPEGSDGLLHPDPHLRYSLLDGFFDPDAVEADVLGGQAVQIGDFLTAGYEARLDPAKGATRSGGRGQALELSRTGSLDLGGGPRPLGLRKRLETRRDGLEVAWELENLSKDDDLHFLFAAEWNFSAFPGEFEVDGTVIRLYGGTVRLECDGVASIWSHPLQTLSQSEKGFDIIHQGMSFLPAWRVSLGPGSRASFRQRLIERRDEP
jgi:hypothetical protein